MREEYVQDVFLRYEENVDDESVEVPVEYRNISGVFRGSESIVFNSSIHKEDYGMMLRKVLGYEMYSETAVFTGELVE